MKNCNCKRTNYSLGIIYWKKFEENNSTLSLNKKRYFIEIAPNNLNIYHAYISKYNFNLEKKNHFSMTLNREEWRYVVVSKIICIIKRDNFKTAWCVLLFELSPFFQNRKQT